MVQPRADGRQDRCKAAQTTEEHVQDYADALAKEIKGDREPKTYEEATELGREYLEEMWRREDAGELPEGDYFFVDVIKTASADATPLHDDFFNGPRDSLWALGTRPRV